MKTTPIIEKLLKYIKEKPLSYHTPGHKNGQFIPDNLSKIWPEEIWQYDVTEIFDLDNLHYPEGCIAEAQKEVARIFNAKASYFLVNGTSVGIQASILALSYNKPIFVPRHVHKSIYSGIILANAEPIFLPVSYDDELGLPLGVEPNILKNYLSKYPQCKTIVLPNPTYQGISYKFRELVTLAKNNGLQVIVDEAHGSHFCLHNALPPSGLSDADIIIQSWHKTLPVLTQASVLHLGKGYQGPDISIYLNMLQTTSPSYLLLASLDGCQAFLGRVGYSLIDTSINKINNFKEKMTGLKNLKIIDNINNELIDPFKLCITSCKISGYQLSDILRVKYKIYVELAEENYCLLIFPINIENKNLSRLEEALLQIDLYCSNLSLKQFTNLTNVNIIPERKILLREAFFSEKEIIHLNEAEGRISGDFIIKYPPGIPLIIPGEVINKEILKILRKDILGYKVKDGISVVVE